MSGFGGGEKRRVKMEYAKQGGKINREEEIEKNFQERGAKPFFSNSNW
jgi:hypothetical protein